MKIKGHENTGCVFCDRAKKETKVVIYPEDIQGRGPDSMTFDQAKEFLRLHSEAIKDVMREAANGAIDDLLDETEVLL